jgi:indole-3-glycerol phosphate synthase
MTAPKKLESPNLKSSAGERGGLSGLELFKAAKAKEIESLLRLKTASEPGEGPGPCLRQALEAGRRRRGLAVIAEYKRASPSLGDINLNLSPERAAEGYRRADAISVLTEETYFKGSLSFIDRMTSPGLPILRKDFIFHPLQIAATAATKASAVLLIVRLTPEAAALRELRLAALRAGLEAVVEVFDESDLLTARACGATIIQVNRRDLSSLTLGGERRLNLIEKYPPLPGEFWIAASGLKTAEDLRAVAAAGFSAVLIGSALMASPCPGQALDELLTAFRPPFSSS